MATYWHPRSQYYTGSGTMKEVPYVQVFSYLYSKPSLCLPVLPCNSAPASDEAWTLLLSIYIFSSYFFLVVPTCTIPLPGRDLLAKVRTSISFASPICLTSNSPAAPLLFLLATQPTGSNMLSPFPASQVNPQIWDTQNLFVAKHHSPTIIQLQDPTWYITQAQYPEPQRI